ncbi:hypothetical protein SAMN02745671_01994 [Anaerovibrio lipolyticus DSM 3074]|nr:hypothetical protein [Anaerovibrio lipolyticus]SHI88084.1 hypothetical protein SAMN02745671_01994 [Anaerovibrio lipolyticus DSM 3074]
MAAEKAVTIMGFLFRASILADSDPYNACHYSVEEHPHYMDCENCQNKSWCDIFALNEEIRAGREAQTMAEELLKHFEPKRKCKLP